MVLMALKKMDEISEIYDVTGNYYAVVKVRTGDREELRNTLDKIGLVEGITSTETFIVLRNIKEETVIGI